MKTVHLIHGYLGSGKTTFAKDLERRTGGLRITLDDWTIGLSEDHVSVDYALLDRVTTLLNDLWPHTVVAGVHDVILDYGFWSRDGREKARAKAAEIGAEVMLYEVMCPDSVASHLVPTVAVVWARVGRSIPRRGRDRSRRGGRERGDRVLRHPAQRRSSRGRQQSRGPDRPDPPHRAQRGAGAGGQQGTRRRTGEPRFDPR